jgi:hypothetical protein
MICLNDWELLTIHISGIDVAVSVLDGNEMLAGLIMEGMYKNLQRTQKPVLHEVWIRG